MRDAHELEKGPTPRFPVLVVWSLTPNDDGGTRLSWSVAPVPDVPSDEQMATLEGRGLDALMTMVTREEYRWMTTSAPTQK